MAVAGKGDLPAVTRNLDDATVTLTAQVRKCKTDEVDRTREVRCKHRVDVGIGKFFGSAEQAVTRVVDENVDLPLRECFIHEHPNRLAVAHVELAHGEQIGMTFEQVLDGIGLAHGADDAVTGGKQLRGDRATEAA